MPTLTMPDVGESVTEGTVTRWLKHEGESVQIDEPVVEIETEKVSVEVPSPFEGTLLRILVQEGEVAPVGAQLAEFEDSGTPAAATNGAAAQQPAEAQQGRGSRHNGPAPAPNPQGPPPVTDAATTPPPRAASAPSPSHDATSMEGPSGGARLESRGGNGSSATTEGMRRTRRYSPVVLKLAAEHDIPLELVLGTGIEGRVTRQDVMRYLENPVAHTVPPSGDSGVVGVSQQRASGATSGLAGLPRRQAAEETTAPAEAPRVDRAATRGAEPAQAATPAAEADAGTDEVQALSATRRTIAQRMLDAHLSMPPAWMVVEADVSELARLRERARATFEAREGVPLSYMPFFVQAVVAALKEHPALNATFSDDGIRLHHRYHIGVAVAAESGLVVPVVRDADRKSLTGLAREIDDLGKKARDRKLTINDVRGATFTVDNTGAFGSIISQPLIPPGQAAIITTEAIRREMRVSGDGTFATRSVLNLCISFDHRALDGAQVGYFMRAVKDNLEAIRADQQIY